MNEVILRENGIIAERNGTEVSDALRALGARVELGPRFSLRSVLRLLERNPVLTRLSDFAPEFLAQYPGWPASDCWPAGLDCLEFSRVVEMIGHPPPPRLEIYHTLRGRSAAETDMEIKGWQVEMLLDVPLVLGPLRHVVYGDRVDAFRFETVCTLFDFLEGVIWQLAFHGTPRECALRR